MFICSVLIFVFKKGIGLKNRSCELFFCFLYGFYADEKEINLYDSFKLGIDNAVIDLFYKKIFGLMCWSIYNSFFELI